ncbi:ECF RNA polymerase sigma factor RpoE [Mycovorax composti]|uniref:ECF RNA polymerase sigma factor RpoE n=2 Tax=Chitinophagaceae TaxID=563835 RepID=A0ABZ2ELU5_9BACT
MLNEQYILNLRNSISKTSDEAAYKKLFYHFYPLLRRFAYNLLGNAEVAEEIVSDVFLKIWAIRDKLTLVKDLKLYLFKSVKNACINYLKSAAHKYSKSTNFIEETAKLYPSPESEYIYAELHQIIRSAINKLPAKRQLVFRLVKEYGLTYNQVSEVMQISQNTIETHMRHALKKIKHALDKYQNIDK